MNDKLLGLYQFFDKHGIDAAGKIVSTSEKGPIPAGVHDIGEVTLGNNRMVQKLTIIK